MTGCNYFANVVFKKFIVYFFQSRLNEDEVLYTNVKDQSAALLCSI